MSRWLQNVGDFLEKLDDKAEEKLVQQQREEEHYLEEGVAWNREDDGNYTDIAGILASRGIDEDDGDDKDDEEQEQDVPAAADDDDDEAAGATGGAGDGDDEGEDGGGSRGGAAAANTTANTNTTAASAAAPPGNAEVLQQDDIAFGGDDDDDRQERREAVEEEGEAGGATKDGVNKSNNNNDDGDNDDNSNEKDGGSGNEPDQAAPATDRDGGGASSSSSEQQQRQQQQQQQQQEEPKSRFSLSKIVKDATSKAALSAASAASPSSSLHRQQQQSSVPSAPGSGGRKPASDAQQQQQQQKEVRTLRRTVVALNRQLEAAESEIAAQRSELERAADRLDRDAARFKVECDKIRALHAAETKSTQKRHDDAVRYAKERSDRQVQELRDQLRSLEERRKTEGGDWNKELEDALQREREAIAARSGLEDEKATLLSQISTLQVQQEVLGNRLESLTETADNAFAREREAENRLDEALSAHARQIGQRQARESELERTIAELGRALVQARNSASVSSSSSNDAGGPLGAAEIEISELKHELEGLRSQLSQELQTSKTLREELVDLSREREEETSLAQARQKRYDRKVADLSHAVARLKSELRDAQSSSSRRNVTSGGGAKNNAGGDDDDGLSRRVKELSEEVLRQREKLSSSNSEVSALKSRLSAALDRAMKAESSLEEWMESGSREATSVSDTGIEISAGAGAAAFSGATRRRGGGRKGRVKATTTPTMRSALRLDAATQGEGTERIGKSLDLLDRVLLESGKFLRYNPLARLLFIAYLTVLHLWTFLLLFVHAHGFESVHGDFGSGNSAHHGPAGLMQASASQQQIIQQRPVVMAKLTGGN